MSNFLFLFRGGDAARTNQTPEEMQEHVQKWGAWMGGLKEKGQLVDGLPLAKEGNVVHNAGDVITDGPFAEGSEVVGGYLIVTSNYHLEAAVSYYHCTAKTFENTDWKSILTLYDFQLRRQYSPIVQLNRIVPFLRYMEPKKPCRSLKLLKKALILKTTHYIMLLRPNFCPT